MSNSIHLKAYAKINIGLDVISKRDDGYHELRMIMQSIGLFDKISIHLINSSEIKLKPTCPIYLLMKIILFIKPHLY